MLRNGAEPSRQLLVFVSREGARAAWLSLQVGSAVRVLQAHLYRWEIQHRLFFLAENTTCPWNWKASNNLASLDRKKERTQTIKCNCLFSPHFRDLIANAHRIRKGPALHCINRCLSSPLSAMAWTAPSASLLSTLQVASLRVAKTGRLENGYRWVWLLRRARARVGGLPGPPH